MRVLFFHAVAEHRKIALPLMGQASDALEPFDRYLRQAISAARERQFRYKLPWKRVEEVREIELVPLDTRLRIPREPPGWFILNWPVEREPNPERKLMVSNRDEDKTLHVVSWERQSQGLCIKVEGELRADDQVRWCGVECRIQREAEPAPLAELHDATGQSFAVVHDEPQDEHARIVHVRGRPAEGPLVAGGRVIDAEKLPDFEGVEWVYEGDRRFRVDGPVIRGEELPEGHEVRADRGLRFRIREKGRAARQGVWIQLLPPDEIRDDDFLDPRAAFCEDDVKEVWTQPRHHKDATIEVKRVDRERYQLCLGRLPPKDVSLLYLPVDTRNLERQRRALRQLREAPLPHHRGLLRLCEKPAEARWPHIHERWPDMWYFLKNPDRSGTEEQRRFVARALCNSDHPDLVLLEGPPGSGKTTAICELVRQCIARGERVLLCASTHVAIDNVLERLAADPCVDAVRIGLLDRVDDNVQRCQLDERVRKLAALFRDSPAFRGLGDRELWQAAERTVIMGANLTAGTTMGILNHPLFDDRDAHAKPWERPIATMPHWDVLIVDEASKTTIQDFMVPALMARRHVIVGDVRQLPPFTDREDLIANLRGLSDERDRSVFPPEHQRARLLLFRLARRQLARQPKVRWLIVEPSGVIDALTREIEASEGFEPSVARIVARRSLAMGRRVQEVTTDEARGGDARALWLAAADWVLVDSDLLPVVAAVLPANLMLTRDLERGESSLPEHAPLFFRNHAWLGRAGELTRPVTERGKRIDTLQMLARHESDWLARRDWAGEVVWRLTRLHELRRSGRRDERERLDGDLERLLPDAADVGDRIQDIEDVGLPSILEVLQEGTGKETRHPSGLTEGLRARGDVLAARLTPLSFQHRMHPEISSFSREVIYDGAALRDANTIAHRDEVLDWDFAQELGARRVWLDVGGHESHGVNQDEVAVVEVLAREFLDWARRAGAPRREAPRKWEVACLCFYLKQERALREMLQRLTKIDRDYRFPIENVEIVCGVVDRFQGREADLVLLSMRNTGRIGFLDSPNRLNVAVTRARQQLVITGNAEYFARCEVPELQELVNRTRVIDGGRWLPRRRGVRGGQGTPQGAPGGGEHEMRASR